MKYTKIDTETHEKMLTLDTEKCGTFEVYKGAPNVGRWFLVKNGYYLAWMNKSPEDEDFSMTRAIEWAEKWYRNANTQVKKLDSRIESLQEEQNGILFLLGEK